MSQVVNSPCEDKIIMIEVMRRERKKGTELGERTRLDKDDAYLPLQHNGLDLSRVAVVI